MRLLTSAVTNLVLVLLQLLHPPVELVELGFSSLNLGLLDVWFTSLSLSLCGVVLGVRRRCIEVGVISVHEHLGEVRWNEETISVGGRCVLEDRGRSWWWSSLYPRWTSWLVAWLQGEHHAGFWRLNSYSSTQITILHSRWWSTDLINQL